MGERIVRNDEVVGSIPTSSTNLLNDLATISVLLKTGLIGLFWNVIGCRLNAFMQSCVFLAKPRSQQILLNAGRAAAVLAIPIGIRTGFGQHDLARGIPTHGA